MEIHALSFLRHPVRTAVGSNDDWLLAAGEQGGPVSVWDVRSRQLRTRCLSGFHDVAGVAFSPDGTLVAGAERGPAQLWDAATGQLLLALGRYTLLGDVAFSPDGKRVAVSSVAYFGSPDEIAVWDLERGRGLHTMRGLSARIAKVRFSANGRLLAALAADWQVGIWDWQTRQLRQVLDVPAGVFADNAGFAFSPDGSQFAFVSGKHATLWDVASGKQLRSWTLPPELQDQVAFPDSDTLLVIRIETLGGKAPPHGTERSDHPRVCRVRNLLGPAWQKPLGENKEFRGGILSLLAAGDGRFFLAEGNLGADRSGRVLKAFDSRTAAELWCRSLKRTSTSALIQTLDPTGRLLVFPDEEAEDPFQPSILIATDSWQEVAHHDPGAFYLSPGGEWRARYADPPFHGWAISHGSEKEPRVVLGIDMRPSSELCEFNPAGNLFTWGNPDGTVMVCDIPEVGRKLVELDLGW